MTSYIPRRFVGRDYNIHQDKTIVLQKLRLETQSRELEYAVRDGKLHISSSDSFMSICAGFGIRNSDREDPPETQEGLGRRGLSFSRCTTAEESRSWLHEDSESEKVNGNGNGKRRRTEEKRLMSITRVASHIRMSVVSIKGALKSSTVRVDNGVHGRAYDTEGQNFLIGFHLHVFGVGNRFFPIPYQDQGQHRIVIASSIVRSLLYVTKFLHAATLTTLTGSQISQLAKTFPSLILPTIPVHLWDIFVISIPIDLRSEACWWQRNLRRVRKKRTEPSRRTVVCLSLRDIPQ
jgi:hypothetical protein